MSSPQNPPAYSAVPQGPTATVIHTTAVGVVPVVVGQQVGPKPITIECKSCKHQIVTRVEKKPTTRTHLFAVLLCVLFCWPCVCVPYCIDTCNNADHYCPNCGAYIGTYTN